MSGLYTEIINTTRTLIVVLDTEGRIVMFNPACERVSGYRFEEAQGRRIWDFLLLPGEAAGVKTVFSELKAGHFPNVHANYWLAKSGERRFIEWSNSAATDAAGRVTHIIGTGIDVTEKRAVELALREALQRQRALLEATPDPVWMKSCDGRYLMANHAFRNRVGPGTGDLTGKSDFDIYPAAFAQSLADEDRAIMASGQPLHKKWSRLVNGREQHYYTIKVPVVDASGATIGTAGISRDITEVNKTEQALRATEQRQRALLDGIPDAAWLMDADERYVAVNHKYVERWKLDSLDPVGKTFSEILPQPVTEENTAENREILRTGKPLHIERRRLIRGREYWFDVIKTPVIDETGNVTGIVGISRDITEKKLADAQRSVRDAALRAALVKEVHHRIKNNLQGVIALMQRLATEHPGSAGLLDAVIERVNTIASVHGLYGAIGKSDLHLEQILLTLVSSLKVLHADLPVLLSIQSAPERARVAENEAVPLALIVNELIMNAIKHSRGAVDGKPVEIVLERAANCARITIRAHAGRLPRYFDFDTGAGLGTGLALVKSLLPPAGAALRFENTAGSAGTQIELTLRPPVIALPSST